jgi:CheY-like chemotaxis protein
MKKILIVEDEEPMRRVLKDTLEQEGFIVFESSDGKAGLEEAFVKRPDLILLDILMPKMDGMTVLKQLREEEWGKGVPVVILTNLNDASTVINALEFEIDEVADMRAKNEILSPEMARKCIKRYLDMRLENGVEDFLIKTDCTLEEIVKKVKTKLGIR